MRPWSLSKCKTDKAEFWRRVSEIAPWKSGSFPEQIMIFFLFSMFYELDYNIPFMYLPQNDIMLNCFTQRNSVLLFKQQTTRVHSKCCVLEITEKKEIIWRKKILQMPDTLHRYRHCDASNINLSSRSQFGARQPAKPWRKHFSCVFCAFSGLMQS